MDTWIIPALLTGLVGSLHCAGMCGPLVIGLHGRSGISSTVPLVYHLGRITSYSMLGFLLGAFGAGLALPVGQRTLSLALGAILILAAVFQIAYRPSLQTTGWGRLIERGFRRVSNWKGPGQQLGLGFLNGLLPCGLTYVALAASLATADPFTGAMFMAFFGLGTAPVMLFISFAGKRLFQSARWNTVSWLRLWTLILGILLLVRGLDLGIPYLSPELPQQVEQGVEPSCH